MSKSKMIFFYFKILNFFSSSKRGRKKSLICAAVSDSSLDENVNDEDYVAEQDCLVKPNKKLYI